MTEVGRQSTNNNLYKMRMIVVHQFQMSQLIAAQGNQ